MTQQGLDTSAIRYAVRVARRLEASEYDVRLMVHAAVEPREAHPPIRRTLGERYDGSGPDRLAGTQIPVGARILAVVRAFEALLLCGRDPEEALTHIKRRSGAHLDPTVVDAFLNIIREDAVVSFGYDSTAGVVRPTTGSTHSGARRPQTGTSSIRGSMRRRPSESLVSTL